MGFYLFLVVLLLVAGRTAASASFPIVALLALALFMFLVRYLSTRYWMDADYLGAWRLFGSRKVRLEEVRRIEFANLRDLGPVGMFGSWGWRGRMWSPTAGTFDAIHTTSSGLLVSSGKVPMFISPKDPPAFARELSRRVRSYNDGLDVDAGAQAELNEMPAGF